MSSIELYGNNWHDFSSDNFDVPLRTIAHHLAKSNHYRQPLSAGRQRLPKTRGYLPFMHSKGLTNMSQQFDQWAARWPQAAAELVNAMADTEPTRLAAPASEARAQQEARMQAGRMGGVLWRNNVGATKAKEVHVCPRCTFSFEEVKPPLRYGLCNDSEKLNAKVKSSDLIGIYPYVVQPQDVGRTLGLFWAVEVKAPGESINLRDERQKGQASFGALVQRFNGRFEFSHGGLGQ